MQMTLEDFKIQNLIDELDEKCECYVRGGMLNGKKYIVLSCYEDILPYGTVDMNEDLIYDDEKYLRKQGYKFEEFDYEFDEMDVFEACEISNIDMDENYTIFVFE